MTAFLSTFSNIIKSLLGLLFEWKVVGNVSIGSIFVGLFIVNVAFTILIKGATVRLDDLKGSYNPKIRDIRVDSGSQPKQIETRGFTLH